MLTLNFITNPDSDEVRQIIKLYRIAGWWDMELGLYTYSDESLVLRIIAGSHYFITASIGDEIVGMGRCISDRVSDAYIQDITVKAEYRKQDVGSKIVEKLLERLLADGFPWIGLIAEKGSCNFYQRLGFEKMPDAVPMLKILWKTKDG